MYIRCVIRVRIVTCAADCTVPFEPTPRHFGDLFEPSFRFPIWAVAFYNTLFNGFRGLCIVYWNVSVDSGPSSVELPQTQPKTDSEQPASGHFTADNGLAGRPRPLNPAEACYWCGWG